MANLVITIDGPAASGKSTVAGLVAERLGAAFLDTGAMYRAVTLAAMRAGVDLTDEKKLLEVLESTDIKFSLKTNKVTAAIDGADVTEHLRRPEVTANARYIAAAPKIREKLVRMQRQIAAQHQKIVTEGRDQGTVAFADADVKFYLTAEPAERARRRQTELQAKGTAQEPGDVQKAIVQRDRSDEARAAGPMKPASDAIIIDTTKLSVEKVVQKILGLVEAKCSKKG